MRPLSSIMEPVGSDLNRFESDLIGVLESPVLAMDEVMKYVSESRGKRLRPALVFLSSRVMGDVRGSTCRAAVFVELLHMASLLHDDVVDESDERRGRPSVNARFDNRTAILSGDYLLARAMSLLMNSEDLSILDEMMVTAKAMCEGELQQLWLTEGDVMTDEDYLGVITRKTAMLMRSCCMAGAMTAGADDGAVRCMGDYGLNLGIVFQMRDDQLDHETMGHDAFIDAQLPVFSQRALDALKGMPESDALHSLCDLVDFCAHRSH